MMMRLLDLVENWDVGYRHPKFYCWIYPQSSEDVGPWEGYGEDFEQAIDNALEARQVSMR